MTPGYKKDRREIAAEIKVMGQIGNYNRIVDYLRGVDGDMLKKIEFIAKDRSTTARERINMVSILSGREVSKAAHEKLANMRLDEWVEAEEDGLRFESRLKPGLDKDGNSIMKEVWFSKQAQIAKQATDKDVSEDEFDKLKYRFNRYENRRDNGLSHKAVYDNIIRAIKTVRRERMNDELEVKNEEIKAKKDRCINIAALGDRLLKGNEVQEVKVVI